MNKLGMFITALHICACVSACNRVSTSLRLAELEKLGSVPIDGTFSDWQLAQRTSWWGKPVDPNEFWQDRVVWLDRRTFRDAHAYGRKCPPIPVDADVSWLHIYRDDKESTGARSLDDTGPSFWGNSGEWAFWNRWALEHPRPPAAIEKKQLELAEFLVATRHDFEHGKNYARHTARSLKDGEESICQEAIELGYPPEAFNISALLHAHTQAKRLEYRQLCEQGRERDGELSERFRKKLYISEEAILRPDVISTNDSWRILYLKRLRAEGTDESYISAYLDAWSLDESVLGEGSQQ